MYKGADNGVCEGSRMFSLMSKSSGVAPMFGCGSLLNVTFSINRQAVSGAAGALGGRMALWWWWG